MVIEASHHSTNVRIYVQSCDRCKTDYKTRPSFITEWQGGANVYMLKVEHSFCIIRRDHQNQWLLGKTAEESEIWKLKLSTL